MSGARQGRGRILRWGVALAVTLLIGALAGRAVAPDPPSPTAARAPIAGPGGVRTVAGVPVSFPETASGAASAAAAYQQSFATPAILRPGVLRRRVDAVATPDYAPEMLAANGPGVARLAAGPVGVGVREGLRTIYAAVPIGYRVLSFKPGRAEIETWGFTLLGNAGSVEPAAYFGTARTNLAWSGGRWRIAGTEASFGPTPRLATPTASPGGYEVLNLTTELQGYVLAP
jgi:hypothetical protein